MRTLLENDFPAYYGVGRRRQCVEVQTSDVVFDLREQSTNFVVGYRSGEASFSNANKNLLSVINFAEVSCPAIEAFGFRYFRISHDYTFKL